MPGQYGRGFRGPGVDSAYRVVNKFMPQGPHSSAGQYGPQGYGPTYQPGMADGLQRMVATAISSYGGMASMMMEMLNCMYGSGGQGGYGPGYCEEWNSPYGYPAPCELATYVCTTIPIDIKSNRRCEAWLEFYDYTSLADLTTSDLSLNARHNPSAPPITGVAKFAVATGGTAPSFLQIDLTQPSGVSAPIGEYQAAIMDNKSPSQQRGTLTLCLW
jgi:hypothetical protein